jgi:prephenate dehydrogenase
VAFQQITVVGVGLIGGSFALGARQAGFRGTIVGCDRPEVLARAQQRQAIDAGCADPVKAVRDSDLIMLATPVGAIIDFLEQASIFPSHALITDVGSTKALVVERARAVLGSDAATRFLPGHPMAGKELSGVEQADPDLFRNALWLITPLNCAASKRKGPGSPAGRALRAGAAGEFLALVESMGARVLEMEAQRHDRLCAWVSHLPQMMATALAATLEDEFQNDPELASIGGRALREMTRIASSPYSMWRDIALTNAPHIQEALLRLEQRLAHIRENLGTRELAREFATAQKFRQK